MKQTYKTYNFPLKGGGISPIRAIIRCDKTAAETLHSCCTEERGKKKTKKTQITWIIASAAGLIHFQMLTRPFHSSSMPRSMLIPLISLSLQVISDGRDLSVRRCFTIKLLATF